MTESDDQPTITLVEYAGYETMSVVAAIDKLERSIAIMDALGFPCQDMKDTLRELNDRR